EVSECPEAIRCWISGFFAIRLGFVVCPSTNPSICFTRRVSSGSPPSTRILVFGLFVSMFTPKNERGVFEEARSFLMPIVRRCKVRLPIDQRHSLTRPPWISSRPSRRYHLMPLGLRASLKLSKRILSFLLADNPRSGNRSLLRRFSAAQAIIGQIRGGWPRRLLCVACSVPPLSSRPALRALHWTQRFAYHCLVVGTIRGEQLP